MTFSHGEYVHHLRIETARLAEVLGSAPDDVRVPTCPDWTAADLRWHLAEVQHFWADVVVERPRPGDDLTEAVRPAGRAALEASAVLATGRLADALTQAAPDDVCWSWAVEADSCGWVARRQAHEALVHRLDAELATGQRTPFDPALALDGVDEVLRYFWSYRPQWAEVEEQAVGRVRVALPDEGAAWLATFAHWSGTSPHTGKTYAGMPTLLLAARDDGGAADATISGSAQDVDCFLWGRPGTGPVAQDGDAEVLAAFASLLSEGVQ